jgi:hypothetical protein
VSNLLGLARAAAALMIVGPTGASSAVSAAQAPRSGAASPTVDGCVHAGSETRLVKVAAGRGDLIQAAILGRGGTGVVLANQSDRNLCAWLPFAQWLRRAGYRVLLFDYGTAEPGLEVAAAARTLHRFGGTQVVLVGASEGAKASIVAGARPMTPASAVVSISAERYLGGIDVKSWAARLRRPVLFLMAKHDPLAAGDTRTLYRACASPSKKLVTFAGDAHGVDLLVGARGARVRGDILAFLSRYR